MNITEYNAMLRQVMEKNSSKSELDKNDPNNNNSSHQFAPAPKLSEDSGEPMDVEIRK